MPRFVCGAQSEIDQIIAWSAAGTERVVNHGVFTMTRPRIRKDESNGPPLSRPNGSLEKSHETNELITIFATMVKHDKSNIGCENRDQFVRFMRFRLEEHTSELQSHSDLVCRLLLEKKKKSQYKNS